MSYKFRLSAFRASRELFNSCVAMRTVAAFTKPRGYIRERKRSRAVYTIGNGRETFNMGAMV